MAKRVLEPVRALRRFTPASKKKCHSRPWRAISGHRCWVGATVKFRNRGRVIEKVPHHPTQAMNGTTPKTRNDLKYLRKITRGHRDKNLRPPALAPPCARARAQKRLKNLSSFPKIVHFDEAAAKLRRLSMIKSYYGLTNLGRVPLSAGAIGRHAVAPCHEPLVLPQSFSATCGRRQFHKYWL
jgi:hypothetical protein